MKVVVVVGNPKIGSGTGRAADMVVERLIGTPQASVAEVAELAPAMFDHLAAGERANTPVVALMIGASPRPALAGEHTLTPVVSEIGGASRPWASSLLESTWGVQPRAGAMSGARVRRLWPVTGRTAPITW